VNLSGDIYRAYLAAARAGRGVSFFSLSIAALQGNPIVTSTGLALTLPAAPPQGSSHVARPVSRVSSIRTKRRRPNSVDGQSRVGLALTDIT
jgi:hypothetical protein